MLSFGYDALGRKLTETGPLGTMASAWDLAGRRTRLTWPDSFHVDYDHLVTGETIAIRENGATSGIGVLAVFAYDQLGRRTSLTRGNGVATSYAYDAVSRLSQQALNLDGTGTANDLTLDFTYNPASQIASTTRSNDLYAWTSHGSGTTSATANGLNQLSNWVSALGHDAKGNITLDGAYAYAYSSENLLTSLTNSASGAVQSSATFAYDPLMRLAKIDSSNAVLDSDLGHDRMEIVLEGLSSNRTRRYVFGPGVDEPLVAYLVTSTGTSRSWYVADERGSTLRQSDDSGAAGGSVGRYDEYGAGLGTSRLQYTGQYWLADANLHYYRARVYDPRLGRFLQPDPIGYDGGMNLYGYVGGDPINFADPLGLIEEETIEVTCDSACQARILMANAGSGSSGGVSVWARGGTGALDGSVLRDVAGAVGGVLDRLAEDYLKPPEPRQPKESRSQCMRRTAGSSPALGAVGVASVAAGGPFLGYPRQGLDRGGRGSSLISYAARGSLGSAPVGGRLFGTGNLGGVVGRGLSRISAGGGAAAVGWAAGTFVGAQQICR